MHRPCLLALILSSLPLLAQQATPAPKLDAGDRGEAAAAAPANPEPAPSAAAGTAPAAAPTTDSQRTDRSMDRSMVAQAETPPAGTGSSTPGAPPPGGPGGGFGGRRGGAFGGPGGPRPGGAGEGGFPGMMAAPSSSSAPTDEVQVVDGKVTPMQFPNNPVQDLLTVYEMCTGMTIVKDTSIFEGPPVSLETKEPIDVAEAVKLIEATLLTNGYALIIDPSGKSARVLPTRLRGGSDLQFSQGIKFYTDPKLIPTGETLVTYFMPILNVDPQEAADILANHVGLNVYGRITPVASPGGLLITESANIVHHLIGIGSTIDTPATSSSLITKFIPVKFADATVIAQIVQATLTAQAQEKETKGIKTIRGTAGPEYAGNRERKDSNDNNNNSNGRVETRTVYVNGQPQNGNQQQPIALPSTQVVADARLNQILVVGSPDDYTYVASLIQEFDKPVAVEEPYERKLNYVYSVEVISVLADLLKDPVATSAVQLPGGGSLAQQNNQLLASSSSQLLTGRNTQTSRGGRLSGSTGASFTDDGSGTSTGTASSGLGTRADQLIAPEEDNTPVSVTVGKTRLVADPQSNTIYVIGPKESIDKVDMLLSKLDQKPQQVFLATVIGQLTLGDGLDLGVDWVQRFRTNSSGTERGYTGSFLAQNPSIVSGGNISDLTSNLVTTPFGPISGLNFYGQLGNTLDAYLNAMETTKRFKVISRPSVFALNNKKATITSGQVIPVPSLSTTFTGNNSNGSTQTQIEYKDVVLKLEVVPLINSNGEITLTIAQLNDSIIGTQRVEPNDIPIIGTEQLVTTVTVPDGHTVVLGGLISEQDNRDTAGVPAISRLPLVGGLFRTNKKDTNRKELIIFIQPQLVADNNALMIKSSNEDMRTRIGAEAFQKFPEKVPAREEGDPLPGEKPNMLQRLFKKRDLSVGPAKTSPVK